MLTAGTIALAAGALLASIPDPTAHAASFAGLMLAAILRKGIFPAHSWVPNGLDQSPPALLMLLLNGHLGGFLVVRYAIPMMADVAGQALSLLSYLALFTALYAAFLALTEKRVRRILGFLSVSQASFVLAGLENRNTEGVTGALVHWFVVTTATTGLVCVYRALEARYPAVAEPNGYFGLATRTPRLATFFAICGLALVGLPGTLGFAAEDLLFHGSLESHPLLGLTLPIATALNGITIYRLFVRLFLGRATVQTPAVPDALPGERWGLSAAVVFLVAGGILPSALVALREPAAEHIVQLLTNR
jgi:NADH-quinone oxidoreductase subunit M